MRILFSLPSFYFRKIPSWFIRFLPRLLAYEEDKLALFLHLRMFFIPLFQDTSLMGRILSLLFRTSRIVLGILVIFLSSLLLSLLFLLYLLAPFLLIVSLKIHSLPIFWVGSLIYFFWQKERPLGPISGNLQKDLPFYVGTGEIRKIFARPLRLSLILSTLSKNPTIQRFWAKGEIEEEKVKNLLRKEVVFEKEKLWKRSLQCASELKEKYLTPLCLLLAMIREKEEIFADLLTSKEASSLAHWLKREREILRKPKVWDEDFVLKPLGGVNRAWTARATPTLDQFGVDLTRLAQKGKLPKVVGKEKAIAQTIRILSRSTRNHVLILGEAGCGKTVMVQGLAQKIIEGGVPKALFSKRIVSLNLSRLLAGTKTRGEFEGRLIKILDETKEAGNVILFLDEIHNLARITEEGEDILGTFEPYLSSSAFQTIGATTWENFQKFIEPQSAFANLFQIVSLPEATIQETLQILQIISLDLEKRHRTLISLPALEATVELSERFIRYRVLPDKAVAVLEEAVAWVGQKKKVTREDVARTISAKVEIPLTEITKEESEKLLHLEERLHQRIINQEKAIKAIADAMRRARVGLKEEKRPICALLFIGPTGVGKTEIAKALAEIWFGKEEAMVRLDMSEFQTKESINKLLGSPPSGENPGRRGILTDTVRQKPFTLLLLDEIEKAHPDILNVFLAIIEDGRATDGRGRVVHFNNTIIIATSNAGTYLFEEGTKRGWQKEETEQKLKEELRKFFRPEFLNRFDSIIICKSLSRQDIQNIVKLKLAKLAQKMAKKKIYLDFEEGLIKKLAQRGYHPTRGARPLRRLIANTLENWLARKMLEGSIREGEKIVLGKEVLEESL